MIKRLFSIGSAAVAGLAVAVVGVAAIVTPMPAAAGNRPEGSGVLVGMTDTAAYFPRLRGRRVAVLANQTSVARMPGAVGAEGHPLTVDAAGRVHLVDLLLRNGKPQLHLRFCQCNPERAPGAEFFVRRKNILHFAAGIPSG